MLNFIILVSAFVIANLMSGAVAYMVMMRLMSSKWFMKKCMKMSVEMVNTMEQLDEEEEA